ncbi:MAG: 5-formyltetrahydrofolate cyclo-ligase [bacterium]
MSRNKENQRKRLRTRRQSLELQYVEEKSKQVCDRLEGFEEFQKVSNVGCYLPLKHDREVDLRHLIQRQVDKKNILLPRMNQEHQSLDYFYFPGNENTTSENIPIFHYEQLGGIEINQGVPEPRPASCDPFQGEPDLVLVPGVGFDESRDRLGLGAGYFDRYLHSLENSVTVGVGYDFQVVDSIVTHSHDITLDYVVTPSRII